MISQLLLITFTYNDILLIIFGMILQFIIGKQLALFYPDLFSELKTIQNLEKKIISLQSNFDYVTEELSKYETELFLLNQNNTQKKNKQLHNYDVFIEENEVLLPDSVTKLSENFIESVTCPITKEIMVDPWIDYEGNSYEKKAIVEYLKKKSTSTITRNPLFLNLEQLYPNRALRDIIQILKT